MSLRGRLSFRLALVIVIVIGLLWPGQGRALCASPRPLVIFHADSLSGYVSELAREFQASHPDVKVRPESSGSLDAIRKVTDLHQPCDILITADWRLLAKPRPGLAPWVTIFAGNSMGILYTSRSKYAHDVSASNWFEVLTRPGVRYGHSNPERDPAGYWTLVLWRLAARYYHRPGLAARLAANCPPANIRPHSVFLIAMLQSGELDYYFGYRSDARLGRLRFLALPPAINLSEFDRRDEYAGASIEVGSGANRKRIIGAPIAYGATLTTDPPHRAAALEFLKLMLGPRGRKAAADNGLIPYARAYAADPRHAMPPTLSELTRPLATP
ncbi:MAG: extracellular solute-binding protein [Candidatus Binataceae bacterium]